MADDIITDGMLDMFIFETEQGLENLQNICLDSKDIGEFDEDNVNEIFRIMHTIKGASAVIEKDSIAGKLASDLAADELLILTNVDYVYLHFGKENQTPIKSMTVSEAKNLSKTGSFGETDMLPKNF